MDLLKDDTTDSSITPPVTSAELTGMVGVADSIFTRLSHEMGFTFYSINIIDKTVQLLRNVHAAGIAGSQKGAMWSLKDLVGNLRLEVINSGVVKTVEGPAGTADQAWYTEKLPESAVRIFVPIRSGRGVFGSIETGFLKENRAALTQDDLVRLESIVRRTSGALENARLLEELNQERHLLHTLMDNIPDSIYFKDTKSRFIRATRAMSDRIGLSNSSDLIGKTDFDIFTKEHAQQAFEDEQRILKTGVPEIDIEEKETWTDNRVTWVSTTKMPLRADDGTVIGTFGVSRDITSRKEMEDALRFRLEFEEHITSLSSTFINLDLQAIDGAVAQALSLIGKFTLSDYCMVLLTEESLNSREMRYEWRNEVYAAPETFQSHHLEIQPGGWLHNTMSTGNAVNVSSLGMLPPEADAIKDTLLSAGVQSLVYVPLIYSGALAGMIGVESINGEKKWPDDITALLTIVGEVFMNAFLRKRAEEELHRANQVLEQRVYERTEDLKKANDQLTTHIGQLQFLNDAVYRLSPIITAGELLPVILDLFMGRFSGAKGGICLSNEECFTCVCTTAGFESLQDRNNLETAAQNIVATGTLQPFFIENCMVDKRVNSVPWTGSEKTCSVVAIPLLVDSACRAIVLIMTTAEYSGVFTSEQFLLTTLASHASICLSNALHYEQRAEKARLDGELDVARSIQQRFTPHYHPDIPGVELKGVYFPAYKVGGDYLDYFKTEQGDWVIAIADVCGKGIPAALLMTTMRSAFRIEGRNETSARRLLCAVNRFMLHNLDEKSFVTAICIIISSDGKQMCYARAGHPLMVRIGNGNMPTCNIGCNGIALGLTSDMSLFATMTEEKLIDLVPGDSYMVYTDGVTEAFNAAKNAYGFNRLKTILDDTTLARPGELVDAIVADIRSFTGSPVDGSDDLTILAFTVTG